MTRVDFYLLQNGVDVEDKMRAACKLADKAFRQGHGVYLHTADDSAAQRLDDLLWTYSDDSFVPHALYRAEPAPPSPVLIGSAPPPPAAHDVLLSLGAEVPEFFSRFERVIELVGSDDADKARSRERFRFYRDRGYPLQTHPV